MDEVLVVVPRASMPAISGLDWAGVVQLADNGAHGLTTITADRSEQGMLKVPKSRPGYAFLRRGDAGQAWLFLQDWR